MPQSAVRELPEHSALLHAPVISDPSGEAARSGRSLSLASCSRGAASTALTAPPSLPTLSHATMDCGGMKLRDERELKIEHSVAGLLCQSRNSDPGRGTPHWAATRAVPWFLPAAGTQQGAKPPGLLLGRKKLTRSFN